MKKLLVVFAMVLPMLIGNVYSQKVYVTKTGEKYHKVSCGYLRSSSIEIDLADAIAKGYTACSVCKPSQGLDGPKKPLEIVPEEGNPIVYITKSGTKYHTPSCRFKSETSIPIYLQDAKQQGYTACSVCHTSSSPGQSNLSPQSQAVQCSAITKAGARCLRMTKSSNGKCWQHGGS